MSKKPARDATTPTDSSDEEFFRPKKTYKVRACFEPAKENLWNIVEEMQCRLEQIESSIFDWNKRELPLTDGDIKSLDRFFERVQDNMDSMKQEVNHRRAELLNRAPAPPPHKASISACQLPTAAID